VRAGVLIANVILFLKILIYPLDEISGGISAGSACFPLFSGALVKE
jgi:hypothetical protein